MQMAEEKWNEWWGETTSGPKPTGWVEVKLANGTTRTGSATFFTWNVIGHRDDIRYWRPASPGVEYGVR